MTGQIKTVKTSQYVSPQREEEQSQIGRVSDNQFVQYDRHSPNLEIQLQFQETFLTTAKHTRTIRDIWIEMRTIFRNLVIGVIAIALGLVGGLIASGLLAALERLSQQASN